MATVNESVLDQYRLALIRRLWAQDTIPSWPPFLIEDLGLTMPPPMGPGPSLIATQYELSGAWATPNLDHYERWSMRIAPDSPFLGFYGGNGPGPWQGSWGYTPTGWTVGQAYVPVFYFAPKRRTNKCLLVHDGHAPYGQPGHRDLIKWGLEHGFGCIQIIMPYLAHGEFWNVHVPEQFPIATRDIMSCFFEASTNAISHAETLGYSTFVMEGISGGGWTVHFLAALDTRITVSYPVSGAFPFTMDAGPSSYDAEQTPARTIYSLASIDDLFAMSISNGRRATQMLSEFDFCCFRCNATNIPLIQAYVARANARATGRFQSLFDMGSNAHDVTPWKLAAIEADLRELGLLDTMERSAAVAGAVSVSASVLTPVAQSGAPSFFGIAADGSGGYGINAAITRPSPGVFSEVIVNPYEGNGGILAGTVGVTPTPISASVTPEGIGTIAAAGVGVGGFTFSQEEVRAGLWHAAAVIINGGLSWAENCTFARVSLGRYRLTAEPNVDVWLAGVGTPITAGVFTDMVYPVDGGHRSLDIVCTDAAGAAVEASITVLFPREVPTARLLAFGFINAVGGVVPLGFGFTNGSNPATGQLTFTMTTPVAGNRCAFIARSASGDGIGRCYAVEHVSDAVKSIRWANRLGAPWPTACAMLVLGVT